MIERSTYEVLDSSADGPVVRIAFTGIYPPGSEGNPVASAMQQFVADVVAARNPAAVLLDLTEMEYTWGDAINGIVLPLFCGGDDKSMSCRVCVIAAGGTAKALAPFFGPNWLLGMANARLFGSTEQALESVANAPHR